VDSNAKPRSRWPYVVGVAIGLLAGLILFVYLRTRNIDDRTRQWVVRELQQRFNSDVELEQLHVKILPKMGVNGAGLSLRYHNRRDLPPMFHVQQFSFNLGVLGILRAPRHIAGIYVENMTITIPPRGEKQTKPPSSGKKTLPTVIVDEIVCNDTDLVIVPKKEGKDPLDFDIHDLVLKSVGADKPFDFHGNLTNAKPQGEIATKGTFGPWDADEPGDTPVAGTYRFTDANLGPLPGIAGTLSSTGDYHGQLDEIEVTGKTDTPNFSLDPVGHPVVLHTDFSATVNGTDGDTYLHPVRATLGQSLIIAEGSIVRVPAKQGHIIKLDITAPNARIQDILSLAINSDKPFMSGPAKIKATLLLPPGNEKVLQKMVLDGQVDVEEAQWSSPEVRDKLASLSRHAEGKPQDEDAGSSVADLKGDFRLEKGVIQFRKLTFGVAGAQLNLTGNYDIGESNLDFQGQLRLQAKLSQTVTGKKSFFLKMIDPLFSKQGAGTLLPITITGKRDSPTLGVSVFHKTFKKKLGGDDKNATSNQKR
jgi:AsmA-like C-terminal region